MITEIYLYFSLSLLVILILYNLNNKLNYLSFKHKIIWIIALLPFFCLSIFLTAKTYLQNTEIIYKSTKISFYINNKLSLLVLLIILNLITIFFIIKEKKLIKILLPTVLNSICIILIIIINQISVNFFIAPIITLITYYLHDEKLINKQNKNYICGIFYWQILSDLLIIFGLFYHLSQNNLELFTTTYQDTQVNYLLSTIFILLGILMKIILLDLNNKYYNFISHKTTSLIATLIILYKYINNINDKLLLKIIIISFLFLALYAIIKTIKNKDNIYFLAISIATFLIAINRFYEPFFIIIFYSFIYLLINDNKINTEKENKQTNNKVILFIQKVFLKIISPLYGNFLFFILPQLCLTIFQIPLKLLHSGSLKRSLVMVLVIFITYFYMAVN